MTMTKYKEGSFDSSDGIHSCHYIVAKPDGEPRGIVQISHGMCEYIERYLDFMSFLTDNGYVVCGNDHLGHGHTVDDSSELGYFSEQNGWQNTVEDLYTLTKIMKLKYPKQPYFLLGHSMGSFLARAYAIKHAHECDGYIFMGTADGFGGTVKDYAKPKLDKLSPKLYSCINIKDSTLSSLASSVLISQAETIGKIKGDTYRSAKLNDLAFGKYNERIDNPKTEYDWISKDEKIVDKYAHDPLCTFMFTVNGYINLCSALAYVSNDRWFSAFPKDIPALLLAGDADPVGNYGKGVKNVYNKMCEYRCQVSMKLYEGDRHELLNETNRTEVYADILEYIDSITGTVQ